MSAPWAGRRLHFVGVGGAGMSGYARVAHALGAEVSGSDAALGDYLRRLAEDGILEASIGHAAANVPAGEDVELIYSSAVPAVNPERAAARERGLPERPARRAAGRAERAAPHDRRGRHARQDDHRVDDRPRAARRRRRARLADRRRRRRGPSKRRVGERQWLVVEADESDRSMLSLDVEIAVLTNVEIDHHASFASLGELREAFREFLAGAHARPSSCGTAPSCSRCRPRASGRGVAVVAYDVPEPTLVAGRLAL